MPGAPRRVLADSGLLQQRECRATRASVGIDGYVPDANLAGEWNGKGAGGEHEIADRWYMQDFKRMRRKLRSPAGWEALPFGAGSWWSR